MVISTSLVNSEKQKIFGEMVQKGILLLMKRDTMGVSS